jgi:hypothetical protein
MLQTYLLGWLDSLILTTLNPRKNFVCTITTEDLSAISEQILSETLHIQIQLNQYIFLLLKETEIRLQVKKYQCALIILLDNAVEYQKYEVFKKQELSEVMNTLVNSLEELLAFIESRFLNYLDVDERVPVTYFEIFKNEFKQKLDKLKQKLVKVVDNKCITDILLIILYAFIFSKNNSSVTYREVLYRKELISELDNFCETPKRVSSFSALDELLIYMNFNSIKYINYFKSSIVRKIDLFNNEAERLKELLFLFKEFNQMYSNENIRFNPKNQNLKTVISDWFIQEIAYLEKKIGQSIIPLKDSEKSLDSPKENNKENKITCLLSADQIGLILRASDESRILNAKSMSAVFKMIVPHLSTPYKSDLSYHSVRSKSYNAEDKDKEIAIETLEKIIKKIKTY